ncbi:putative Ig domain-containing protein [Nocardioides sp. GXQ0305]|uniref:putative Ig domain-containing protein n=1 Tax=Nocardioides sp. GXQ0305 TaxID=3423912 RepID=UPI003D7EAE62
MNPRISRLLISVLIGLGLVVSATPPVQAANDRPVIRAIADRTVSANDTVRITPRVRDDGPDGRLRFATTSRPSWLRVNRRTGVLRGTVPVSAMGRTFRVALRVSDGRKRDTEVFRIRVRANQRPTLDELPAQQVEVGDDVSYRLPGRDADGPRALRYDGNGMPAWLSLDRVTGQLSGTAPEDAVNREFTPTFRVQDGRKTSPERTLEITVVESTDNSVPTVADQELSVEEGPAGTEVGTLEADDSDGDDLTWSLSGVGSADFTVDSETGVVTAAADLDHEDRDRYDLQAVVSDGTADATADLVVLVTDVDEPPVVTALPDRTVPEDAQIVPVIDVEATDPEGADVTVTVTGLPAGVSYNDNTGAIQGRPSLPGTYSVTVSASDGALLGGENFELDVTPVNDAPVIANQDMSVAEGAQDDTVVGTLVATDEEGDDLTFAGGTGSFSVAPDGEVRVRDASVLADGGGPFTVPVTVTDGDLTANAVLTVTVADVDNPPVADDETFEVDEDAVTGTVVGSMSATDADGDSVSWAITGGNAGGAFAIDAATGEITVAAALDHEQTDTYELEVEASSTTLSDTATATVEVTDVNEAPSVAPLDDVTTAEDADLTAIEVVTSDPEDDDVTVSVTGLPVGVTYAPGPGTIAGTPSESGEFTVVVTADDGELSAVEEFVLEVTPVNDAPVLTSVADVTLEEDSELDPVQLAATDADGDELVYELSSLPAGLVFDADQARITGTPTVSGTYVVTATVRDGNGGSDQDEFTITVTDVNDAPVAGQPDPALVSLVQDADVEVDVEVPATDEEGDPLTFSASGLPAGVTAEGTETGVALGGAATEAGEFEATVTVDDGRGGSDTATFDVTVEEAAADPCAPLSTLECSEVPVSLPFALDFDGTEGGLADTGFTMVDPPSLRSGVEQAPAPATPSVDDVPGYEPGLLTVDQGRLTVTATKGIQYRAPGQTPAATMPNAQLNALGVGVAGSEAGYDLSTTVVAPTFPGPDNGAQQGGLWFGLGEDDYAKAVVSRVSGTTNKVQLLTEIGGVATPGTTYEINSAPFPSGTDVTLDLEVVDGPGAGATGGTVQVYYRVGSGQRTLLADVATPTRTSLAVPQEWFDGTAVGSEEQQSFAGLFATKRNAQPSQQQQVAFGDFAVDAHQVPNRAPVVAPVDDQSAVEEEAFGPVELSATDADEDELTLESDLDVEGLTFTDEGDGSGAIEGTPAAGTAGTYDVTVSADDGEATGSTSFTLEVEAAGEPEAPCAPISTDGCSTVPVSTPYALTFDGTEGGLDDTGFTMVDEPSARSAVDQAPAPASPTHPEVPGFEPGQVGVAGGDLVINATKGIAFRNPAGSVGTNSQLNTMGVGLEGGAEGHELRTTVVAPSFPSSSGAATSQSQQGGLWWGLDEDNFVKLAVVRVTSTTNKVQLVKEVGATATPATTYELNSAPFPSGQDVELVLDIDASGDTPVVSGSYRVGAGQLTQLTDSANPASPELPLPDAFVDGAALPAGGGDPVVFGGLYATKRNAAAADQVDVRFASFAADTTGGSEEPGEPFEPVDLRVNFQSEAAPVPSGFLRDFGQAYGERTGADQGDGSLRYGWVRASSEETLSLVGNGRDRDRAGIAQELDTVLHMQYGDVPNGNCTPSSSNVCEDGDWQLAVEDGTYEVTVAVGDQQGATAYDSQHAINLENQALVEQFQATAGEEYRTATARVGVVDGELTVSAQGGTNTKIAWVRVRSASTDEADPWPFIVDVRPGNRSTGALRDEGIATDLHLVGTTADPGPVDESTVTTDTVRLFKVLPGGAAVAVPGNANTSGGGDTINFQQAEALDANSTYRFVVDGVEDELGNEFVPFTSVFTTGTTTGGGGGDEFSPVTGVSFEKVDTGKNGRYFASLVVHEGYLWATTIGQGMFRYPINADGTLGAEQTINAFAGRAAVGLVFDREDPDVAWVTNATANLGNESATFGSKLTRVDFGSSVANPTLTDVFVNLPRSAKDHLSNSLSYGPGGDLYFLQGSNQAAGDPDGAWGNRGETLLSAALLTFDPDEVWAQVQANGPINVQTVDKGGPYNPFAAGAPLKIYATGIRNAYDLVHTDNGRIYVPTNGTASGGNSPGVTANGGTLTRTGQVPGQDVTDVCRTRRIDGTPYTAPSVPAVTNHSTQRDFLFDVEQGGYYGHPNPSRCEWVLNNGGLPEGAGSNGSQYPATVQPDRNYRGWAYDFEFNKSPNGVIQYRSSAFGGKLKGRLMVVRFSNFDDIITLQPGSDGEVLGGQPGSTIGGFSGFDDPLDIVEDTDTGNLYVNSYDQSGGAPKLYLLRVPSGEQAASLESSTERLVANQPVAAGSRGIGTVTYTNTGQQDATVTGASLGGAGAAAYSRTVDRSLPATVPPGGSISVTVSFDPSAEGVAAGQLTLTTSTGSVAPVALRGLGTEGEGGSLEPSLQYVLDTLQLGIDTGDDNDATPEVHSNSVQRVSPTLGDALDVETFERSSDGPVTVEPLAAFGPGNNDPVTQVSWYGADAPGEPSALFSVGNSPARNAQTLLPTTSGATQFDPGQESFGFVSRWPFFANRMVYSQDSLNTFTGAIGNHVRVYRLVEDGATVPNAYVVATEEHTSGWDYNDVVFVVRNVRPAGEEPEQPPGDAIKVNFQSETAAVPSGYLRDFGQGYGARSGADQGTGLTYGWINAQTGAAEGRVGTGRDRDLNPDQRFDTLMHMQYQQQGNPNCTANSCTTGAWELQVPDGSYQVTVGVGDPSTNQDPEQHQVRAEGVPVLAQPHVPSGAAGTSGHHAQASQVVSVTDGRLTIDPTGGLNTKIDFVEVLPVEGGGGDTVAQVNFQPAAAATPSGWSADTGALFSEGRGYGWVRTEGGAAKTADTRQRTTGDPLDSTLVLVDDSEVTTVVDGEWEHALPNGTYTVTASVGDPDYADSTHGLSAEGIPLVTGFVPSAPGDYDVASATVEVTDGRLTVASTGTNTKLQWLTIASGSGVDAIAPTVALDVTGVTGPDGFLNQATVTAEVADAGGSGIEFVDWSLDGEEIERPQGDSLVVDELGSHSVEVTATDAAGNETTEETSFEVVEGAVSRIAIANQDAQRVGGQPVPGMADDFLVMHHLANVDTGGTHPLAVTHDVATLRITNSDPAEDLVVSDLELGAPVDPTQGVRASTTNFTLPGVQLPLRIEPGQFHDLEVDFGGSGSRGIYGATLTIESNAANAPALPVQLRGFWQPQPEGGTEPTMTQVARTFGYTTAIGEPLEDEYAGPLQGDEVRSLLWKRLDPSQPVTARQLTALHGCCTAEDSMGSPVSGAHDGAWGQSFYPRAAQSGNATAAAPFRQGTATPAGNFALTIAGYTSNKTPTQTDPANLGIRAWPVEVGGTVVPGAYLVGQDFVQNGCGGGSANCDYQDNVYLVTNIAPVASQDTTAPTVSPTGVSTQVQGSDVRVGWNGVALGDLGGYVVERQAAGASGWTAVNTTPVAGTSLVDRGAPGNTQVSYRVVAVDTSGNRGAPSDTSEVTTPPRPQAAVRINAGGPAVTTGGTAWGAQQYGTGGKTYTNNVAIAGTTDDVLYQTEYSTSTGSLAYDVPVENGRYTVRLHFAEIYHGAPGGGTGGVGRRVFDVAVEGTLRIDNYDIFADVGAAAATVKSYSVDVTDGKVDIDLTSVVDQAKISAIEVVPAAA